MVDAIRQGVAHIFDLFELASASASAANNRKFHYCLNSKQKTNADAIIRFIQHTFSYFYVHQ